MYPIALINTTLHPRDLRARITLEIKPEHKKGIAGFVLFVVVFMFATMLYTLIAVYVGALDKLQIAFSLGFIVLLAIVYLIWNKVKAYAKL